MTAEMFVPRSMSDYEVKAVELLKAIDWNCKGGQMAAGFALAAMNASIAMKEKFGFQDEAEFRHWAKDLPCIDAIDYPFPSAQTNNALIACIDHVKSCSICAHRSPMS